MIPNNGRPGDVRYFVHKRLIGAVTGAVGGLLSGGNPIAGAIGGFAKGGGGGGRSKGLIPTTPFGVATCPTGFWLNPLTGQCQPLVSQGRDKQGVVEAIRRLVPTGETGEFEFGDAVMGRYGAALEPGLRPSDTRVCPRGTILGLDGLCYNKRDLKNSERMWPRGRRPLLTGGDMRCISIAAAAAKKLQKKTKQLQSMGMLKKPTSRRSTKALAAGHHAHVSHD